MKKTNTREMYQEMLDVASFPAYLFMKHPAGYVVDKLFPDPDNKDGFRATQYPLMGGVQCTCLGWMKFKKCKHLQALHGEYDFLGDGVMAEYAKEEADRLIGLLSDKLPESVKSWKLDVDKIPSYVQCLSLKFTDEAPSGLVKCFWTKKFSDGLKMGVEIDFA